MEKLLTVGEAAEVTRVSEGWWRQRIARKELKVVYLGGRVLIPQSTVDEIIRTGTTEPVGTQ
jgi:excisionase family DNA binding protein